MSPEEAEAVLGRSLVHLKEAVRRKLASQRMADVTSRGVTSVPWVSARWRAMRDLNFYLEIVALRKFPKARE